MQKPLSPQTPEENRESNRRWLNAVRERVFDGSAEAMADALDLPDADRVVLRRVLSGAAKMVPDDLMQKTAGLLAQKETPVYGLAPRTGGTDRPTGSSPGDSGERADAGAAATAAESEESSDASAASAPRLPKSQLDELPDGVSVDDAPGYDDLHDALAGAGANDAPTFALFDVYTFDEVCVLQLANGRAARRWQEQNAPGDANSGEANPDEAEADADAAGVPPPLALPILRTRAGVLDERGSGVSVIVDLPDDPHDVSAHAGRVCICRRDGRLFVRRVVATGDPGAPVQLQCPAGRSEPFDVDPAGGDAEILGVLRTLYQRL